MLNVVAGAEGEAQAVLLRAARPLNGWKADLSGPGRLTRALQITRAEYDARADPDGAIYVGSPQQIIDKLMHERELFRHQRFMAQIDIGGLPFARVARVIELFATKVAPAVRG